jgi:multidrug efflux pump subunit AcrA (membrane-fusion protein)
MPKLKIALVAFLVVTVAVTLFLVLTPGPTPTSPRPAEAAGLTLRGYENGILAWEARAERGEIASEAGSLSGIVLRAYDGPTMMLEVSARELRQEEDALTLAGAVRGETEDGLALSSEQMKWVGDEQRLKSEWTLLDWGEDELTADAFEYDTRQARASLTGVRGTLRRDETFLLSSERGEITRDSILLTGSVEAASDEETLRASELEASIEADEVTLRGGVSVSASGLELCADSLVLTPDGRIARGRVSVDVEVSREEEARGA